MNNSIRFGIVQGRLTQSPPGCLQWFPQEFWEDEFRLASEIGINYIELIAEIQHNPLNPIWSEKGVTKIKRLVNDNNLSLHALCNDFIIKNSLLEDKVIQQNIDLISQGKKLGVEKYVMPLFESSELTLENLEDFIEPLKIVANAAKENNMITCLETILNGEELLEILKIINLPYVKIVYDTGNRVAFGHNLAADIKLLGGHIAHVHIKDKNTNNENTLLGTGLVDFEKVFYSLRDINYDGPFTFETVRGSNPLKTAVYNMSLVEFFKLNAENCV
jgi:L-ribulose-5-phosphate 3-epimerase